MSDAAQSVEESASPKPIMDSDSDESIEEPASPRPDDDSASDESEGEPEKVSPEEMGLADGGTDTYTDTDSDLEDADPHQKLDVEGRDSFLDLYHPEAKVQNFSEVLLRTRIVRDAEGRVADPDHRSLPFLSKYELTRVLGLRARQLDSGATPLVDVPPGVMDGYNIAEAELEAKKIPFIVRRPMPGGGSEYWRLEDMELLRAPAGLGLRKAVSGTSTSSGSRS